MSEDCRDFIKRALEKNPLERPTVVELLTHPWIKVSCQALQAVSKPRMNDQWSDQRFKDEYWQGYKLWEKNQFIFIYLNQKQNACFGAGLRGEPSIRDATIT